MCATPSQPADVDVAGAEEPVSVPEADEKAVAQMKAAEEEAAAKKKAEEEEAAKKAEEEAAAKKAEEEAAAQKAAEEEEARKKAEEEAAAAQKAAEEEEAAKKKAEEEEAKKKKEEEEAKKKADEEAKKKAAAAAAAKKKQEEEKKKKAAAEAAKKKKEEAEKKKKEEQEAQLQEMKDKPGHAFSKLVQENKVEEIKMLVSMGADVNALDGDDKRPMEICGEKNLVEALKALMTAENIDLNYIPPEGSPNWGESMLHLSVENSADDVFQLLCEVSATGKYNMNHKNTEGKTVGNLIKKTRLYSKSGKKWTALCANYGFYNADGIWKGK